ncbi:MAG: ThuA domain-containing protein [Myxococcota bacterium]
MSKPRRSQPPIQAQLVAGGRYHDIDFARRELLTLLGDEPRIRTRVAEDYRDTQALADADCLITYTCDVAGTPAEQQALADFVASGKRWFALHGTNSVLEMLQEHVRTPRDHPVLMQTLGSQFLAHPPIGPYDVTVSDTDDPLVSGIEPFEVTDELYLCEYHGPLEPLLETRFSGKTPGFEVNEFADDAPRLVMYKKRVGEGCVLYLTLGHCRGHYDMRPLMDFYPQIERGAWESPTFYELLRRGIRWAAGLDERA